MVGLYERNGVIKCYWVVKNVFENVGVVEFVGFVVVVIFVVSGF